jgi:hypothetical protein
MTEPLAPGLYGIMAEFAEPEPLLDAAHAAYRAGYRAMDAFTPYPVEGLSDAIGFRRNGVALLALLGGLGGGTLAFAMQAYCNVIDYPINVAGRPDFSWPAFVPVTFELTVLGAALSAAFGMLALNRLPRLWHPAFNLPEFARASRDRFFLCFQAKDGSLDPVRLRELLGPFQPLSIREVGYEE